MSPTVEIAGVTYPNPCCRRRVRTIRLALELLLASRRLLEDPACWTKGVFVRAADGEEPDLPMAQGESWSLAGAIIGLSATAVAEEHRKAGHEDESPPTGVQAPMRLALRLVLLTCSEVLVPQARLVSRELLTSYLMTDAFVDKARWNYDVGLIDAANDAPATTHAQVLAALDRAIGVAGEALGNRASGDSNQR